MDNFRWVSDDDRETRVELLDPGGEAIGPGVIAAAGAGHIPKRRIQIVINAAVISAVVDRAGVRCSSGPNYIPYHLKQHCQTLKSPIQIYKEIVEPCVPNMKNPSQFGWRI